MYALIKVKNFALGSEFNEFEKIVVLNNPDSK